MWPGSLEALAAGLRDLDRERGLYVSQVSHDLRNPLAVIGAYASVLRSGEPSRPRAAKLRTIEEEVSRLAGMVDDLLALGRTHALALHLQRSPTDIRELVTDAVAAARSRAGQTRVLLLAPPTAVPALVDAQRVGRRSTTCWTTPSATRTAKCASSSACEAECELVLGVEDDGPGIDRTLLPRLFDAFAQGSEGVGASGMGLSTVRAVAEAHGGGVTVGAARLHGARFTVRLPLVPAGTVVS